MQHSETSHKGPKFNNDCKKIIEQRDLGNELIKISETRFKKANDVSALRYVIIKVSGW